MDLRAKGEELRYKPPRSRPHLALRPGRGGVAEELAGWKALAEALERTPLTPEPPARGAKRAGCGGGARKGAGRPRVAQESVRFGVTLPRPVFDMILAEEQRTGLYRTCIVRRELTRIFGPGQL